MLSNLDEHALTHELIVREVKLQVKLPACLGLVDLSFFFKNFELMFENILCRGQMVLKGVKGSSVTQ